MWADIISSLLNYSRTWGFYCGQRTYFQHMQDIRWVTLGGLLSDHCHASWLSLWRSVTVLECWEKSVTLLECWEKIVSALECLEKSVTLLESWEKIVTVMECWDKSVTLLECWEKSVTLLEWEKIVTVLECHWAGVLREECHCARVSLCCISLCWSVERRVSLGGELRKECTGLECGEKSFYVLKCWEKNVTVLECWEKSVTVMELLWGVSMCGSVER